MSIYLSLLIRSSYFSVYSFPPSLRIFSVLSIPIHFLKNWICFLVRCTLCEHIKSQENHFSLFFFCVHLKQLVSIVLSPFLFLKMTFGPLLIDYCDHHILLKNTFSCFPFYEIIFVWWCVDWYTIVSNTKTKKIKSFTM